ncbi:general substrate transporter, partial [Pavlovales sp. CCMP2436]
GAGLGPIPWLLPAEVFGMDERASASGFAASCNWFANFAAAQMFLPLSNALGGYSFLPFGGFIAVSFILTFAYLPETRGKTLETIRAE